MSISKSSQRDTAPVTTPVPAQAENPSDTSALLTNIDNFAIPADQALKALWGKVKINGEGMPALKTLASKCGKNDIDAQKTRLEVTRALLDKTPGLESLAKRVGAAIDSGDATEFLQAQVSGMIDLHLDAKAKIAESLGNVFFTFLHLTRMTFKTTITDKIATALASRASAAKDALTTALSKAAVNKEARTLLASHIRLPKQTNKPAPAPKVGVQIKPEAAQAHKTLTLLLNRMPDKMRQHPNWPNVERRMIAYLNHTIQDQGDHFIALMNHASFDFPKLLDSMEISCKLDDSTARKMAFQRELDNMGNNKRSMPLQNMEVTGWARSFANESARAAVPGTTPEVLLPGNQLSLAVDTPMVREDGAIVNVTVLSFVGPALDSDLQPEYALYATWSDNREDKDNTPGPTSFNNELFKKAYSTIKSQALAHTIKHPDKKEFALTGVGLDAYLAGLMDGTKEGFKADAQKIGARILAELAIELRQKGIAVVFTDLNDNILNLVNAELADIEKNPPENMELKHARPIGLVGKIPGNWITPGIVIFNAWDTHTLLGNKQKNDPSIDGAHGANTLIHLQHAFRCATEAEGIPLH
jgi:hypothetical protein